MSDHTNPVTGGADHTSRSTGPLTRIARLVGVGLVIAAVVKEMRTPATERAGHGRLAGWIPYDLRRPTLDRVRERLWNEEGPILTPQVFGVGWTVNLRALFALLTRSRHA